MSEFLPIPLTAAGGNSRAARSARARLQWRDRYGRWIEMGRGVKFKVRFPDGTIKSVIGKFVGARPDPTNPKETQGQVYVSKDPSGLPDGFYNVNSANGQEIVAQLDEEGLERAGVELGKNANGQNVGERLDADIPNSTDPNLYSNAPEGWVRAAGEQEKWTTEDGDFTLMHNPDEREHVKQWTVLPADKAKGSESFKTLPDAFEAIEKDDQGQSPFKDIDAVRQTAREARDAETPAAPTAPEGAADAAKQALADYDTDGTLSRLIDEGAGSAEIFKALEANEAWRADAERFNADLMADSLQPDQKAHIAKMEPIRNAILGLQGGSEPKAAPVDDTAAPAADAPAAPEAAPAVPTETREQLEARLVKAQERYDKATRPEELDRLEKTISETEAKLAQLDAPQDSEETTPSSEPEAPVAPEAEAPATPDTPVDPDAPTIGEPEPEEALDEAARERQERDAELEGEEEEVPAETAEPEPAEDASVPEGEKAVLPIQKLKEGDYILGEDGQWHEVQKVEKRAYKRPSDKAGRAPMSVERSKVTLDNGEELETVTTNGSEGFSKSNMDVIRPILAPQTPENAPEAPSDAAPEAPEADAPDTEATPETVPESPEAPETAPESAPEAPAREETDTERELRELKESNERARQDNERLRQEVEDLKRRFEEQKPSAPDETEEEPEPVAPETAPEPEVAPEEIPAPTPTPAPSAADDLTDEELLREIEDIRRRERGEEAPPTPEEEEEAPADVPEAETPDQDTTPTAETSPETDETSSPTPEEVVAGQYLDDFEQIEALPAGARIVTAGSKEAIGSSSASRFSKAANGSWVSGSNGKAYPSSYLQSFHNPKNGRVVLVESLPGQEPTRVTPTSESVPAKDLKPGDRMGSGTVVSVEPGSQSGKVSVTFIDNKGQKRTGDWWGSTPIVITAREKGFPKTGEETSTGAPRSVSENPGLPTNLPGDEATPEAEADNHGKAEDIGGIDEPTPDATPDPEGLPDVVSPPADPDVTDGARLDPPSLALPEVGDLDLGYEDKDEDYADEKFMPTDEQRNIIKGVLGGNNVAVEALAGTGKTSTLELLAKQVKRVFPKKRIIYVAFNKSVQEEAEGRMPDNVESRTGDSIAWRGVGQKLTKKRNNQDSLRLPSAIASHFGIRDTEGVESDDVARDLDRVIKAFAISADDNIMERHFADLETPFNPQTLEWVNAMWDDIKSPDGQLNFRNDHATKIWALSRPDLSKTESGVSAPADIIFFDEAQDINPVMARVIADQSVQKIYVGDGNQAIYGFRGAENELQKVSVDVRLPLTKSWRFGPQVAGMGNRFLSLLDAKWKVVGGGGDGQIVPSNSMEDADAVLTRTNAGAVKAILEELGRGRTVGVSENYKKELISLIESVRWLSSGSRGRKPKLHDDLAGYKSWDAIERDVDRGKADKKVEMLFKLVQKYTVNGLQDAVDNVVAQTSAKEETSFDVDKVPSGNMPGGLRYNWDGKRLSFSGNTWQFKDRIKSVTGRKWDGDKKQWYFNTQDPEDVNGILRQINGESQPVDVVVTTAHKAKGLEWDRVKIMNDFRGPKTEIDPETGEAHTTFPSPEEMRLAYVAVTRAAKVLDPGSLEWVYAYTDEYDEDPNNPSRGLPDADADPEGGLTDEGTVIEEPPALIPPEGKPEIDFDGPYEPSEHDGVDPTELAKEKTPDELEEDLKRGLDDPEGTDPRPPFEAINEQGEKDPRDIVAKEYDDERGDTTNEDNLKEWRDRNPETATEPEVPPTTQNPGPTSTLIPNNEKGDYHPDIDPTPHDAISDEDDPDTLAKEQDLKELEKAWREGSRRNTPDIKVSDGDGPDAPTRNVPTPAARDAIQKRGKDTNALDDIDHAGDERNGEGEEVVVFDDVENAPLGSRIRVLQRDWDTGDITRTNDYVKTPFTDSTNSWQDVNDPDHWISDTGLEAEFFGQPESQTPKSTLILYPPIKEATPQPDTNSDGIPRVPESTATPEDLEQVIDAGLVLERIQQWFPGSAFVENGDLHISSVDRTDNAGNRFTYDTLVTRTGNEFFYAYVRQTNHVTGEVRSRRVGTMMQSAKAMESRILNAAITASSHPDHKKWFENKGGTTFTQIDEVNPATGKPEHFREQVIPSAALDAVRSSTGLEDLKDASIAAAAQYLAQHGPGKLTNQALQNITGLSLEDVSELINAISEHVVARDRVRKFWTWVSADGETPLFEGDTVMDAQGNLGTVSHRHYSHHSKGYVYSDYMLVHFPKAKGSKTRFRTSRKLTLVKTAQGTDGRERTGAGAIELPLPELTTRWKNREERKRKEDTAKKRDSEGAAKRTPPADAPSPDAVELPDGPVAVSLDENGSFEFQGRTYTPNNGQTAPLSDAEEMFDTMSAGDLQVGDVIPLPDPSGIGGLHTGEVVVVHETPGGHRFVGMFSPTGDGTEGLFFGFGFAPGDKIAVGPVYRGIPAFRSPEPTPTPDLSDLGELLHETDDPQGGALGDAILQENDKHTPDSDIESMSDEEIAEDLQDLADRVEYKDRQGLPTSPEDHARISRLRQEQKNREAAQTPPEPVAPETGEDDLPDTIEELEAMAEALELRAAQPGARGRAAQRALDRVYAKIERLENPPEDEGGGPEPEPEPDAPAPTGTDGIVASPVERWLSTEDILTERREFPGEYVNGSDALEDMPPGAVVRLYDPNNDTLVYYKKYSDRGAWEPSQANYKWISTPQLSRHTGINHLETVDPAVWDTRSSHMRLEEGEGSYFATFPEGSVIRIGSTVFRKDGDNDWRGLGQGISDLPLGNESIAVRAFSSARGGDGPGTIVRWGTQPVREYKIDDQFDPHDTEGMPLGTAIADSSLRRGTHYKVAPNRWVNAAGRSKTDEDMASYIDGETVRVETLPKPMLGLSELISGATFEGKDLTRVPNGSKLIVNATGMSDPKRVTKVNDLLLIGDDGQNYSTLHWGYGPYKSTFKYEGHDDSVDKPVEDGDLLATPEQLEQVPTGSMVRTWLAFAGEFGGATAYKVGPDRWIVSDRAWHSSSMSGTTLTSQELAYRNPKSQLKYINLEQKGVPATAANTKSPSENAVLYNPESPNQGWIFQAGRWRGRDGSTPEDLLASGSGRLIDGRNSTKIGKYMTPQEAAALPAGSHVYVRNALAPSADRRARYIRDDKGYWQRQDTPFSGSRTALTDEEVIASAARGDVRLDKVGQPPIPWEQFYEQLDSAESTQDITDLLRSQYPGMNFEDYTAPTNRSGGLSVADFTGSYRNFAKNVTGLIEQHPILKKMGDFGAKAETDKGWYAMVQFPNPELVPDLDASMARMRWNTRISKKTMDENHAIEVTMGHFHGRTPEGMDPAWRLLTHETGHVYDVESGMTLGNAALEAYNRYISNQSFDGRADAHAAIGRYGKTNASELWAEIFENWQNNDEVADITKYIMNSVLEAERERRDDPTFEFPKNDNVNQFPTGAPEGAGPSAPAV